MLMIHACSTRLMVIQNSFEFVSSVCDLSSLASMIDAVRIKHRIASSVVPQSGR